MRHLWGYEGVIVQKDRLWGMWGVGQGWTGEPEWALRHGFDPL